MFEGHKFYLLKLLVYIILACENLEVKKQTMNLLYFYFYCAFPQPHGGATQNTEPERNLTSITNASLCQHRLAGDRSAANKIHVYCSYFCDTSSPSQKWSKDS